jgi:hypothetical protein
LTEPQWLACTDPLRMLAFLRGRASDRKFRLFACACWRRLRHLLPDGGQRRFLDLLEPHADGLVPAEQLRAALGLASARRAPEDQWAPTRQNLVARWLLRWGAHPQAWAAARLAARVAHALAALVGDWAAAAEDKAQCELLREVFGNPHRPAAVDGACRTWRGGLVHGMAQAAYEERQLPSGLLDNARLAVLADGLEEAGCEERQVLDHLRAGGDHIRGCFVVDAILEKS